MFKKILVPLDGSPLSEQALAPAVQLAQTMEAELLLLRCAPRVEPMLLLAPTLAAEFEGALYRTVQVDRLQEVRDYLAEVQRRCQWPGGRIRCLDSEGEAAAAIVDSAHEQGIDLVVMSTHGQTGVRRAVFGSVTERVMHGVACPLLVVRSTQPIRRMLITLDGSPLGERVLLPAVTVARGLGAQVVLLRVIDSPASNPLELSVMWEWDLAMPDEQAARAWRQTADQYLSEMAGRVGLGDDVTRIVLEGVPAQRIEEYARLSNIDLIAMSTHGHTGLRRWLYGSVTARVMRDAGCSMLIVRPPDEALAAG